MLQGSLAAHQSIFVYGWWAMQGWVGGWLAGWVAGWWLGWWVGGWVLSAEKVPITW